MRYKNTLLELPKSGDPYLVGIKKVKVAKATFLFIRKILLKKTNKKVRKAH